MDFTQIIMYAGFILAGYSVVGNDSIQTLGTFLSANEKRKWWVLWLFAGSILAATMIYGWFNTRPERVLSEVHEYIQVDGEKAEALFVPLDKANQFIQYDELKQQMIHAVYPSKFKKVADTLDRLGMVPLQVYQLKEDMLTAAFVENLQVTGAFTLANQSGTISYELAHKKVKDVSYGRLEKYDMPHPLGWWFILPPIILMLLTRTGIPVSTSFLILTFFNEKNLMGMVEKSLLGYLLALGLGLIVYLLIAKVLEKKFLDNPPLEKNKKMWMVFQWLTTAFLWAMWLIQDFANIYVYLARDLSFVELIISLAVLLGLLAYIFYRRGGAIQTIVKSKTNTSDLRSATLINAAFGFLLLYFKELNNIPMSTTWVFLGLLAGREIAIRLRLEKKLTKSVIMDVSLDLGKVFLGLAVSIILVFVIKWMV